MTVAAVLVAAGSGARLGHPLPKALVLLGGEPLVAHAARALVTARSAAGEPVSVLVVTAPEGHRDAVRAVVEAAVAGSSVTPLVVSGGATRQASVNAALACLPAEVDVVLVHDAARPLASATLVGRVLDAVRSGHPAVVPAVLVADTIKRVPSGADPDSPGWPVVATVQRAELRAVQTPQGFDRHLLDRAHTVAAPLAKHEADAASDDAGLVELLGEPVWVVPGEDDAAKVTTARDLRVAQALLDGGRVG